MSTTTAGSNQDQQASSPDIEASSRPSSQSSPRVSCSDLSGIVVSQENFAFFNYHCESLNDPKIALPPSY